MKLLKIDVADFANLWSAILNVKHFGEKNSCQTQLVVYIDTESYYKLSIYKRPIVGLHNCDPAFSQKTLKSDSTGSNKDI